METPYLLRDEQDEFVIAADLGGTYLRAALIDARGVVHHRSKRETPKDGSAEEIALALIAAARECAEGNEGGGGVNAIRAFSVVVPGTVKVETGTITKAPNLPCLDGFNLSARLESELPWRAVLENDANAAAVGERWRGAAAGVDSLICLTLGTGVGGGIILNGELWRGASGAAGEIGHIGVEPQGFPCPCGSRGCLEVYASATAVVRIARKMIGRFPDAQIQADTELTAEKIYNLGVEGHEFAVETFARVGFYLGVAFASLANILNPEMIVIGGGVANGWDLFIEHARREMYARAFAQPARRVQIVPARCGDDAGLLGAARLGFTARK